MQTNEAGRTDPSPSDAALRSEPGQIASHAAALTQPLTALADKPGTPAAGEVKSQVKSQVTRHASSIAQGAVLIAGLTSLSRMLGLVRTLVFSQSVGAGCLGTAYTTANGVPNLIYELALGGALTSAMVPVLARSAARSWTDPSEKARVAQISSALMTWAVVILLPATAIIAATAGPIAEALIPANPNSACDRADMVNATSHMLVIFAPQILLYGLSVVMFGLLNAYRRFTGPALAPVAANVVMISSYLAFAALDQNAALARTPLTAELVLSIGTTLNIGTLVLVALPPTWRLHLRWRPTLKFPAGVIRQAGGLAMVGILEFVAIDLYGVVTIDLANGRGETGALVLSNYVALVFTSVASVLPLAITTSAFPVLSATDSEEFDRTSAGSTRAVVLMSWLGTAAIAAVAVPAANILAKQPDQVPELIQAFLIAAPGVAGLALITQASRILFALGKLKVAAIGLCASPVLQLVLSIVMVEFVPARLVVAALSAASTIGQLTVAIPMMIAVGRIRGKASTAGIGHASLAGLAAAAAGTAVGVAAALAMPVGGKLYDGAAGAAGVISAVLVFVVVAYLLDKDDLRMATARLQRLRMVQRLRRMSRRR
ncbi:MAG TPA: lipid II flippase MurJ [Trebonia sp.]|nr:lipid II flippase MurJ [Trebonia sp.]